MTTPPLTAPFPFFGGKRTVASLIWDRFGAVQNYVEPFCGSAAVLLAAPAAVPVRTINDMDGFITNFYRAVQADPDAVTRHADWPVNEADLFARHVWLVEQRDGLTTRLHTDPMYYDAQIAGWWLWGANAWIGGGWCSGDGSWSVQDGQIVNRRGDAGRGVNRQLPHLGNAGRGVHRQTSGDRTAFIREWMHALCAVLRGVRVTCGDWQRVCTPVVTTYHGLTAVLLDPPYGDGAMEYSAGGNADGTLAAAVWRWAVDHGDDPLLRLAVCGYQDGRALPDGWVAVPWKATGGYGSRGSGAGRVNASREVIWFSPQCLTAVEDLPLWRMA